MTREICPKCQGYMSWDQRCLSFLCLSVGCGGSSTVPKQALELIAEERQRQMAIGWTPEHDDTHTQGEMAQAAACYAEPEDNREMLFTSGSGLTTHRRWPWHPLQWKPTPKDRVRELVKAGALIVAEIERLQRAGT